MQKYLQQSMQYYANIDANIYAKIYAWLASEHFKRSWPAGKNNGTFWAASAARRCSTTFCAASRFATATAAAASATPRSSARFFFSIASNLAFSNLLCSWNSTCAYFVCWLDRGVKLSAHHVWQTTDVEVP